jgi:hypothetical protein
MSSAYLAGDVLRATVRIRPRCRELLCVSGNDGWIGRVTAIEVSVGGGQLATPRPPVVGRIQAWLGNVLLCRRRTPFAPKIRRLVEIRQRIIANGRSSLVAAVVPGIGVGRAHKS